MTSLKLCKRDGRFGPIFAASKTATSKAIVTAVTVSALALTGCASWDETPQSASSNLRDALPEAGSLKDPRSFTGVSAVTGIGDVVPVAENPTPQLPVELTDADGFDVQVDDVSRILALDLYGTYTKTLTGLGLADHIVGRTVSSTEERLKDLPVVTQGGHNINVEAVLELRPSLVIVDHSIGPREAIDQIREAGVDIVVMDPTRSIDSIGQDILDLGGVVGLPDEAKKLADRSVDDANQDREAIAKLVPSEPLRMAFLYARGNGGVFFILGEGSGAQDLIEGVGGVDVAAEHGLGETSPANAEALAKIDPDVFIMMEAGLESTGGIEGLLQRPGVAQTKAGQNKRVITVPDGASLAFGPQTGEVLLLTAQALYNPEQQQ